MQIIATTALVIELTYEPVDGRDPKDCFKFNKIRHKDRDMVSTTEWDLPEPWKAPDCMIVEFKVQVAGEEGSLTLVRSFHSVVPREMVFVMCFGPAVRRKMVVKDWIAVYAR